MASEADTRMSARREGLVHMLFGDVATARSASASFTESEEWAAIFHQAEEWSVVGQLADCMTRLELQVPEGSRKDFKQLTIATYARSASRAAKGVKALAHLEQMGIRAVAFKGVASMARLYARPGDRAIKDIDLLIVERDLVATIASLGEVGFMPIAGQGFDELKDLIEYLPNFSGNKAIVLADRDGLEIDLHWSVGIKAFPSSELIARSNLCSLFGSALRVVSVADALVLTVRHSIRENLAVDSICRDLYDMLHIFSLEDKAGRLQETLAAASASGEVLPLLALTGVLHRLNKARSSLQRAFEWLSQKATAIERKDAASLERLFFHQVTNGRLEKDLLYLAHTGPTRKMVMGAWKNWRGYRGLMVSMEDKLEGKPLPISGRIVKLMHAARQLDPGHLRSLRALARMRFDTSRRRAVPRGK